MQTFGFAQRYDLEEEEAAEEIFCADEGEVAERLLDGAVDSTSLADVVEARLGALEETELGAEGGIPSRLSEEHAEALCGPSPDTSLFECGRGLAQLAEQCATSEDRDGGVELLQEFSRAYLEAAVADTFAGGEVPVPEGLRAADGGLVGELEHGWLPCIACR